jgi:excisionase family DNA binding protein
MREFLKIAEVADLFGVTPPTVRRWLRDGRLAHVRTPGGQIRIPADAFMMRWEGVVDGRDD